MSLEEDTSRLAPFVGRERELGALRAALGESVAGRGRLALVTGEPGVGKTRLVEVLAEEALREGCLAAWGWCREGGGAPAYWPWTQVLRACLADPVNAPITEGAVEAGAGDFLEAIVPGVAARVRDEGTLPHAIVASPDARFRLFDAVGDLVRRYAAERPLFLVLEDLHAADVPSLLFLQFVAGEIRSMPVFVVGTYREPGPWLDEERRRALAGMGTDATTLPLAGLDEGETMRLAEAFVGRSVAARVAANVHGATAGNAFFVDRVLRSMRAEGSSVEGPPSVTGNLRDWVRRWLGYLSPPARDLVGVASIVGQETELRLLSAVLELSEGRALDLLDEAESRGVMTPVPGAVGRHRFRHALLRETAYDDQPEDGRNEVHLQIASWLEREGPSADPAILAHHYLSAGRSPEISSKAIEHSERAATRSLERLAWADAAAHLRDALAASRWAEEDPAHRTDLLVALGEALAREGDFGEARKAFAEAFEVAKVTGSVASMARAAIGHQGPLGSAEPDDHSCDMLRETLGRIGEEDHGLRGILLGRLAVDGTTVTEPDETRRFSSDAVAAARRSGEGPALLEALTAAWCAMSVDHAATPADRLSVASEILELARQHDARDAELWGRVFRFLSFVQGGEIPQAVGEARETERVARELQQGLWRFAVAVERVMLAVIAGRFDEADSWIAEGLRLGRGMTGIGNAVHLQKALLGLELDRPSDVEPLIAFLRKFSPNLPYDICRAFALSEIGKKEEARQLLESIDRSSSRKLGSQYEWMSCAFFLSNVCFDLRDTERSRPLYEMFRHHEDRVVVAGTPGYWAFGPAAQALGVLALTLGRFRAAEAHFQKAAEIGTRANAPPWIAWAQYGLASTSLARRAPGDGQRAARLLAEARRTATGLGMKRLLRKIEEVEISSAAAGGASAIGAKVLRKDGHHWTIEFAGEVLKLRDSKGLQYLAYLLSHPGVEFPAGDLARAVSFAGQRGGSGKAGAAADERAEARYRSRLFDLREDLEEAERFDDLGRAERARNEIERISHELARAAGLVGRDRRASATAENARLTVTKPLKALLRRLDRIHPPLGHHLKASVRTGRFCSYVPDPGDPNPWSVPSGRG